MNSRWYWVIGGIVIIPASMMLSYSDLGVSTVDMIGKVVAGLLVVSFVVYRIFRGES